MNPPNRTIGPTRSVAWVLATIIGLAIGGFALHVPGGNDSSWNVPGLVFGTLLGGVTGLFVGGLQWVVLRSVVIRAGRIPWTMGVIVGATHGAYDFAPSTLPGPLLPIGAGFAAAIAVWLVGGERRTGVLAAVTLGWAAGLWLALATSAALGMPWSNNQLGWSIHHLFEGALIGTVFGVVVALAGVPRAAPRPETAFYGAA